MISHVILELICACGDETTIDAPDYCKQLKKPSYSCLFNDCSYITFVEAPYELAFSKEFGDVDVYDEFSWVGFGGDMEPDHIREQEKSELLKLWEKICKKKIKEAYDEYMDITKFERFVPDPFDKISVDQNLFVEWLKERQEPLTIEAAYYVTELAKKFELKTRASSDDLNGRHFGTLGNTPHFHVGNQNIPVAVTPTTAEWLKMYSILDEM
jgi:hypothetical protein